MRPRACQTEKVDIIMSNESQLVLVAGYQDLAVAHSDFDNPGGLGAAPAVIRRSRSRAASTR
jgi:hypothetical protein